MKGGIIYNIMDTLSDNKLAELEERIDRIIVSYRSAKAENERLLQMVDALQGENKDLKEKIADSRNEKDIIADKVTKILEKIEKAEA
jgi:predicted  nucleic acid-binding Zn-ribbon protein